MLYHLYGFNGKSIILYLWPDDAFGGGWNDVYSLPREMLMEIYMVYLFSLYGTCIASHSLHWHMELCCESMVPTIPVQHRLLGIMMQLHILLGYEGRWHGIAFALWFWDVRCMPWSMALGDIGKKWSLTKDWWRLISSFTWLYNWIRYILLLLFGSLVLEI